MYDLNSEPVGERTMATNAELERDLIEKMEKNRLLEETLEVMRLKIDEVVETT